jgi:hypothetical protein
MQTRKSQDPVTGPKKISLLEQSSDFGKTLPSLNPNQSRNLINTQPHTLNKNGWKELDKRRTRGGKGIFTAEEADAGASAAADTEAEAGSNLAELLGGNLRQPPEEALLNSSSAASQLLPHRLPSTVAGLCFLHPTTQTQHSPSVPDDVPAGRDSRVERGFWAAVQLIHFERNEEPNKPKLQENCKDSASQPTYRRKLAQPHSSVTLASNELGFYAGIYGA